MKKMLLALALALPSFAGAESIILTPANTVNFRGEVNDSSAQAAQTKLMELNRKRGAAKYPIYLVLDSPGGSISAGNDFIDYARTIRDVKTVTLFAASMASAIAEALPGERLITETGTMMFHRASVGLQGQISEGEVESRLAYIKSIVGVLEKRNADRLKIPLADYKARVVNEWWEIGSGAVSANMADRVVSLNCAQSLIDAREESFAQVFIFITKVTYSGCPLFRSPINESEDENKEESDEI